MKKMSKKESLCIITFFIGIIIIISILLRNFVQGRFIVFKFYYKAGIEAAVFLIVISLILLIIERYKIYKKKGIYSVKINFIKTLFVILLVALLSAVGGLVYGFYNYHQSSRNQTSIGIYISSSYEPINFTGENINNPVLTADDITDFEAQFVADPFLIYEDKTFYMFFEVLNWDTYQGDIAFAISDDGFNWSYGQVILDEPFHLSYPCVFKWENEYYMIPSNYQENSIRLYKANDFPYSWSYVKTLLDGRRFVDNTIVRYNNTWWIFSETGLNDELSLYYSDTLLGTWIEHPESPVVDGDPNIARPGGNVVVFNDRIIRYTQDDYPYHGSHVWAFEITTLTKKTYEEHRVGNKPILKGFDNWNSRFMHHISPCQLDDGSWIACVDGS